MLLRCPETPRGGDWAPPGRTRGVPVPPGRAARVGRNGFSRAPFSNWRPTVTTGKYDLEAFRQRARQGDGRPRRFDPREKRNVDRCYGPITYQELYAWGLYDDLAAAHPDRKSVV